MTYTGRAKIDFCRRLSGSWRELADILEIPQHVQARFAGGAEADGIWRWLAERARLDTLPAALAEVGRPDLGAILTSGRSSPAANERLPPRYVHGVPLPKSWADRSAEAERIGDLLVDRGTRILNLVALGGTGKSALLRKVADELVERAATFDSLIWFSFYREEDVERFFLECCRYLIPGFDPSAHTSTFERASLLQDALEAAPPCWCWTASSVWWVAGEARPRPSGSAAARWRASSATFCRRHHARPSV